MVSLSLSALLSTDSRGGVPVSNGDSLDLEALNRHKAENGTVVGLAESRGIFVLPDMLANAGGVTVSVSDIDAQLPLMFHIGLKDGATAPATGQGVHKGVSLLIIILNI